MKRKSIKYVELHKLNNNGNLASPKNLIGFIMDNEIDEVISYFEDLRKPLHQLKIKLDDLYKEIDYNWKIFKDIENQKEFAVAIQDLQYKSLFFTAKKTKTNPKQYVTKDFLIKFWKL